MKRLDLTAGRRFGRLVVLGFHDSRKGRSRWLVHCDCGAELVVIGRNLTSERTGSCGCLGRDNNTAAITTHGHTGTPTYRSWAMMWTRCTNPSFPKFKDYGARGISVCDRWRSFEQFLDDMGERPSGTSIDRIQVNGNYEPNNCRWATPMQQAHNKRAHVAQ